MTCTFKVAFTPTSTTTRSTSIRIIGDGPRSTVTIHASGVGDPPTLGLPSRVLLNADRGMWLGQGTFMNDDPADFVSLDSAGPTVVRLQSPNGHFDFFPREGELLTVGHYEVPSFPPYDTAAFDVGAFGHGCQATGSFDVLEGPTRGLDGALLNVAIDFVMQCDDTTDRLRGRSGSVRTSPSGTCRRRMAMSVSRSVGRNQEPGRGPRCGSDGRRRCRSRVRVERW